MADQQQQKTLAKSVQEKAQEIAQEDFHKTRVLVADAAKSGAYFYPIKGIVYFATHRALWKPLATQIVPTLALSAGVLTFMFVFTYVPQFAILVFLNGPLAVVTTVLLILNESSAIISLVSRTWFLQDALLDTFDGTLVARGATQIVSEGRQLKAGADPIQKLGKIIKSPFERFTLKAVVRYLMYLPLNAIPVVGTVIFIILQGRTRGSSVHSRYFQLKKWSASQQSQWLSEHRGPYTAFGLVATALEMIPFVSILFSFSTTVGAALWAADIEARGTTMTEGTAPNLRATAKKAE